jgi:UDPglucose 6-dehydrogenase
LVNKVRDYFKAELEGKVLALWGLAFKPDTDDIREAPALDIIKNLTLAGAKVVAYDPEAVENVKRYFHDNEGLSFVTDEYAALEGADALLIATEWEQFRTPDYARIRTALKAPVIFDGRNLYDLETMREHGFHYESIGRKTVH